MEYGQPLRISGKIMESIIENDLMIKLKVNDDLFILMSKDGIPVVIECRFNKLTENTKIYSESNWEIHDLTMMFREMRLASSVWFKDTDRWKINFSQQTTLHNPDPDGNCGNVMVVMSRVIKKFIPTWIDVT